MKIFPIFILLFFFTPLSLFLFSNENNEKEGLKNSQLASNPESIATPSSTPVVISTQPKLQGSSLPNPLGSAPLEIMEMINVPTIIYTENSFDLAEKLVRKRVLEFDLNREIDRIKNLLPVEENRWSEANSLLENTTEANPPLSEKVSSLFSSRLFLDARKSTLERRLEHLKRIREVLNILEGLKGPEKIQRKILLGWKNILETHIGEFEQEQGLARIKIDDISLEWSVLNQKLQSPLIKGEEKRWIQSNLFNVEKRKNLYIEMLEELEDEKSLSEFGKKKILKFLNELGAMERFLEIWVTFKDIWNFELTRVDETSVTPGKMVIALFLFVFGCIISKFLSGAIATKGLSHLVEDQGVVESIRLLTLYALVILSGLMALKLINIPLTFFAFLGGALAIGIGFGSQALMNNFISGLILLGERPIQVGDYVDINGSLGTVREIGLRSTLVETIENFHLIIPNSFFLDKNITNWTHTDRVIRCQVGCGVVYGTDVDKAVGAMIEVVKGHGWVLNNPEPSWFFTEFGDNSLKLETTFWIQVRKIYDKKRIESEIRQSIIKKFSIEKIKLAYPQRDVHLRSQTPIFFQIKN